MLSTDTPADRTPLQDVIAQLASILGGPNDAVLGATPDGIITSWSAGAEQLYGFSAQEAVGQSVSMLVPPDRLAELMRIVDQVRRGEAVQRWETDRVMKNGSRVDVVLSVVPMKDADGTVVGATAVARPAEGMRPAIEGALLVRERSARAQAEAGEARFRGLLESAPDAVVIVNADGRIEIVNRQTELTFGYTRDELLGQTVEMLLPERFKPVHGAHRGGYVSAPRTRAMGAGLDLYARRKDGTEFPVEISLSPLPTEEGMLVTSIIRDITDRREVEDHLRQAAAALARQATELERSNADLQQFAYVASHDLQEPLRMVTAYTQLLARRYRGRLDEDAAEFIAFAVDGATRMQALINDLLAYSRVGSQGGALEPTNTAAVFDRIVADLARSIEEGGATVTRGELPTVLADPVQIGQLLQNLVGNAVKFRGRTLPEVRVTAELQSGEWVFAVQDNGIGLAPEYADRVFVIFQRLHTRAEYPGTGIGLAICKKIVERHGGRIWVESQPAEGSTFYFTLPSARAEEL